MTTSKVAMPYKRTLCLPQSRPKTTLVNLNCLTQMMTKSFSPWTWRHATQVIRGKRAKVSASSTMLEKRFRRILHRYQTKIMPMTQLLKMEDPPTSPSRVQLMPERMINLLLVNQVSRNLKALARSLHLRSPGGAPCTVGVTRFREPKLHLILKNLSILSLVCSFRREAVSRKRAAVWWAPSSRTGLFSVNRCKLGLVQHSKEAELPPRTMAMPGVVDCSSLHQQKSSVATDWSQLLSQKTWVLREKRWNNVASSHLQHCRLISRKIMTRNIAAVNADLSSMIKGLRRMPLLDQITKIKIWQAYSALSSHQQPNLDKEHLQLEASHQSELHLVLRWTQRALLASNKQSKALIRDWINQVRLPTRAGPNHLRTKRGTSRGLKRHFHQHKRQRLKQLPQRNYSNHPIQVSNGCLISKSQLIKQI